jgi:hypothetical protein
LQELQGETQGDARGEDAMETARVEGRAEGRAAANRQLGELGQQLEEHKKQRDMFKVRAHCLLLAMLTVPPSAKKSTHTHNNITYLHWVHFPVTRTWFGEQPLTK